MGLGSLFLVAQQELQVGYAVFHSESGPTPTAAALFAFRNSDGILVSEAAVKAVSAERRGRILVDQTRNLTGVAFANASDQPIQLELSLRDSGGTLLTEKSLGLDPRQHLPRFLNEETLFPEIPADFLGTLTFQASGPGVAAVTLRQGINRHGEPIFATLPVVQLPSSNSPAGALEGSVVIPHLGAGPTLESQIILINPTSELLRGTIELVASNGTPLVLELNGESNSVFSFELSGDAAFKGTLRSSNEVKTGYAIVRISEGPLLPVATIVFRFIQGLTSVSEAGVQSSPLSTAIRAFVDTVETQTGVAVACPKCELDEVIELELRDRNGVLVGTRELKLPPGGHTAFFVPERFADLPPGFTGALLLTSETPFSAVTLKLTINARGDPIVTTLPLADLARPELQDSVVIPQIGFGLGFSTRLILLGGAISPGSLRLEFFDSGGRPLVLPLAGARGSSFEPVLPASGALQLRPGNDASVAQIFADPTDPTSLELVVNRGGELILRPLILDEQGMARDDYPVELGLLDSRVAEVDSMGRLTGVEAGFSTLTLQAGQFLTTITLTVVDVEQAGGGFQIAGVETDLNGRIFLAGSSGHVVLRTESFDSEPVIYAGQFQAAGLIDGQRDQALFRNPLFLTIDQASGVLYVSDSSNHLIRRISAGPDGLVTTFAGSGTPGPEDGALQEARFNSPGGLALDSRGSLWIADTGNHLVRRIHLATGVVETVAGTPLSPGSVDGIGGQARFNMPSGIAVEVEPLSERLLRETQGLAASPVSIIVADSGSGLLRRVREDGQVETISGFGPAELPVIRSRYGLATPFLDVAIDSAGNLFLSDTRDVRALLSDGRTIPIAQRGTFQEPTGISVLGSGTLFVGEAHRLGRRLSFGKPEIETINPQVVPSTGLDEITVKGRNFAPETRVFLDGVSVDPEVLDSATLVFSLPPTRSGILTLSVQHRGGLAQASMTFAPLPLEDLSPGEITTIAGGSTFVGDGGSALQAILNSPGQIALNRDGSLLFSDRRHSRIRRVDPVDQVITTIVGTGISGFSGDGAQALNAQLNHPEGLAFDNVGALYVADSLNRRIRRIDLTSGVIDTIAGGGNPADGLGDGLLATQARIGLPTGIILDEAGNLFIADAVFHRVRRVDVSSGLIESIIGDGTSGFSGDGQDGRTATLNRPEALALDGMGNLLVGDEGNSRIRRLDLVSGVIDTIAGNGCDFSQGCSSGDGDPLETPLFRPDSLALDPNRNVFFAGSTIIHRLDSQSGLLSVAAQGSNAQLGDGGSALSAVFSVGGLAADGSGNLYIGDLLNNRIRLVDPQGVIETRAGGSQEDSLGDGRFAFSASLGLIGGMTFEPDGNLLLADTLNRRIREIDSVTGIIQTLYGTEFWICRGWGPCRNGPL